MPLHEYSLLWRIGLPRVFSPSIWTHDLDRALRVAQGVGAGSVWLNDWAKVHDSTEEGGFKQSGLGRLNGQAAMEDFIEYKHITLKHGLPA